MALKYKRILLKLSGEVLKGSSASCHDETILAEVAQPFDAREAIRLMGQGTVALFAGDTGNPFFSTDSGAALRAAEIGADALLKATKVDGIYSANPATGRIAESDGFRWTYLAGPNLKSSLTYPNDAVVTWTYEPHRDLLTAVTNATYSTYVYTNDLLGRRIAKNDEQYGYNIRDCYVENCKKAKECEKNRDKLKQDCDTALGTCIKNTYEAKLGFNLQGYAIGGIYQNAVGFFGDKAFDQACEGK